MAHEHPLSFLIWPFSRRLRARWGFFLAWRIVTYALVLLGFLTLAYTGEIHPLAVLFFLAVWTVGLLLDHPPSWWRGWMSGQVIWIVLLLIGITALQAKFSSILYLLLFLALYKCYTLNEASDHMHAMIISFFMFLACSVISSSLSYLFFLLIFIILLMLDMIYLTIAREGQRSLGGKYSLEESMRRADPGLGRLVFSRLLLSSLLTGVVVLALTFLVFLILPHYDTEKIFSPFMRMGLTRRAPTISGYRDGLTLGAIEEVELDDTPVMKVITKWMKESNRRPMPAELRLRGMALDRYSENEKQWTCHQLSRDGDAHDWDVVNLPLLTAVHGPVLEQKIVQKLALVQRLFGVPMAYRYEFDSESLTHFLGNRRYRGQWPSDLLHLSLDWRTQSLQVFSPTLSLNPGISSDIIYYVYSYWADEAMPLLRNLARRRFIRRAQPQPAVPIGQGRKTPGAHPAGPAGNPILDAFDAQLRMDAAERTMNTDLPATEMSERIRALSRKVAYAEDVPGKIVQLISWFYAHFEYTLKPDTPKGMHPIEAFLMKTHKGHCEYFATACALMLRAQKIPARVVTGFLSSGWNYDLGGFVVRQSDAHVWVEVWLDGYGWLTLDPTPPDWRGRASHVPDNYSLIGRLDQALRSYWQRYVLEYSNLQQARLVNRLTLSRYVLLLERLTHSLSHFINQIGSIHLGAHSKGDWNSVVTYWRGLLLLLATLLLLTVAVVWLVTHRDRHGGPQQRSSIFFMNSLFNRLESMGWKRGESQTPAEFIGHVERETQGRWQLEWVLDLYHRYRFGLEQPTAQEEERVREIIHQIRK